MKFSMFEMIGVVCMVFCIVKSSPAQQTQDIYVRQPSHSARSVAIGDASVGDVHSVGGAVWNPASLVYLESISADATVCGRTDDRLMQGDVSVPVVVNDTFGVGVGGYSAAFDRVDWTRKTGTLYGAVLTSAVRLAPSVSIGAVYDFQMASYAGTSSVSHSVGVGLVYSVLPALTYGVTVTGFGSGIVYRQNDSLQTVEKELSTPRTISLGGVWHYPTTHDRIIVNYYFSGQKILRVDQNIYRMGAELFPWKFLALRAGVVSGPVTTVGRAGIGIRTPYGELDYALTSSVAEARMHVLTLSIPLFSR